MKPRELRLPVVVTLKKIVKLLRVAVLPRFWTKNNFFLFLDVLVGLDSKLAEFYNTV